MVLVDLQDEADAIEQAVDDVLEAGYRTADLAESSQAAVGTTEMGDRIVAVILEVGR